MLQIENPHDRALNYALNVNGLKIERPLNSNVKTNWRGILVPPEVKLATDPRNQLREYY
jgi:hypothetical protein